MRKIFLLLVLFSFGIILTLTLINGCGGSGTYESTTTTQASNTTTTTAAGSFSLSSTAFSDNGDIPTKYGWNSGAYPLRLNTSVPLSWSNAPAGTNSFVLAMVDSSVEAHHWVVINIPSSASSIAEGASSASMPAGSTEIKNSFSTKGYTGPWPDGERHSYVFTLYALNSSSVTLNADTVITKTLLDAALSGKILGQKSITGYFQ